MKKGCVIALIVVVALGAIGIGGCFYLAKKVANPGSVFAIEMAIAQYQQENPDAKIAADNASWAEVLKGYQAVDVSQLINANGQLIDANQMPVHLEEQPDGSIKVISLGKDGELGTDDDVDSGMFNQLMEAAEDAAEEAATESAPAEPTEAATPPAP